MAQDPNPYWFAMFTGLISIGVGWILTRDQLSKAARQSEKREDAKNSQKSTRLSKVLERYSEKMETEIADLEELLAGHLEKEQCSAFELTHRNFLAGFDLVEMKLAADAMELIDDLDDMMYDTSEIIRQVRLAGFVKNDVETFVGHLRDIQVKIAKIRTLLPT